MKSKSVSVSDTLYPLSFSSVGFSCKWEIKYLFIFPKVAVERPNGVPPFPPLPTSPGLAPHKEMASRQCVLLVGFSLAGDASPISCQDRVLCTERDNVIAQFASCGEEACSAPG